MAPPGMMPNMGMGGFNTGFPQGGW